MALGDAPLGSQPLGSLKTILALKEVPRVTVTGPLTSLDIQIPTGTQGNIELLLDLDPTEALDTGFVVQYQLSEFAGGQWKHVVSSIWSGGERLDELGIPMVVPPQFWVSLHRLSGQTIRIEISDPQGKEVGYKLTSQT